MPVALSLAFPWVMDGVAALRRSPVYSGTCRRPKTVPRACLTASSIPPRRPLAPSTIPSSSPRRQVPATLPGRATQTCSRLPRAPPRSTTDTPGSLSSTCSMASARSSCGLLSTRCVMRGIPFGELWPRALGMTRGHELRDPRTLHARSQELGETGSMRSSAQIICCSVWFGCCLMRSWL